MILLSLSLHKKSIVGYDVIMQATIISVASQKGGVGKTASIANLARALVEAGKRVLVIDSDPQSALSIVHGLDPRRLRELDATGKTFYFGLVNLPRFAGN